jgi:pantoate--beta-alanine ligase
MVIAYIGLGSNLGDREANLKSALDHLAGVAGIEVVEVSTLRETVPVGGPSQPPYLNGVAEIKTELLPEALLDALQEAERIAGRRPTGVRWGPREADLDLLFYGNEVIETGRLTVPHPLFRDRSFVLEPLADLAPDLEDPISGRTVHELLLGLMRRRSGKRSTRLIETKADFRDYLSMAERNRFTVGLVPTMGCFHEGHLSLMRAARASCDKVVVTLFVNPTQFGPGEDLDRYPRQLEKDLRLATGEGVDVVFAPEPAEVYSPDHRTSIEVVGFDSIYCGASRPDHFRAVATVVAKLLNLARPAVAFFGQKDYQQSVVIRRMVRDLDFEAEVAVLPTVREEDGLALSSRNQYLNTSEREQAPVLYKALTAAREAFLAGEREGETLLATIRDVLESATEFVPEYAVVVHPETLEPVRVVGEDGAAVLLAGNFGATRLIDNILLGA